MSEHRDYIRAQIATMRPLDADELADLRILMAPGIEAVLKKKKALADQRQAVARPVRRAA